jgi:hypothetical protein
MEAVYAAGSLPVAAGDLSTKGLATRLTIYGLVVIDEVHADGSTRRLRASEAASTTLERSWRVSKPSFRQPVGSLPPEPAPGPRLESPGFEPARAFSGEVDPVHLTKIRSLGNKS